MRFFGWTWPDLMEMPIGAFWVCRRHMARIEAKEDLTAFERQSVVNLEEGDRRAWLDSTKAQVGVVVLEEESFDTSGWNALKGLTQK